MPSLSSQYSNSARSLSHSFISVTTNLLFNLHRVRAYWYGRNATAVPSVAADGQSSVLLRK